ncbi:hypothetical protein [Cellulomonas sp. KRMCY2]|uniref:hypothetical protein n=1 Tax=Cellulomonas sp. KRMCY2 TaxID=1304865 RepID=UPI00045EA318|nr:hypothetical protein [Cellulomonas sp. KRMCY2]
MSTVLHPVGPQPERVYWIRRLVIVLVAVVVVLVVFALLRGGADPDADAPADPAGSADPAAADGAVTDDAAATDPGGPAACTAAELALTLTTDATTYAAGVLPIFTVAVTNTGTVSCTVDAGDPGREILITSGADRIWSSLDCPAEGGERMLLLEPGARDAVDVGWSRIRSAEGCATGLPEPRPGTYNAVTKLLGAESAPVVFDLG